MDDGQTYILELVENLQGAQNMNAQIQEVTKSQATEIYELEKQIKELKSQSIRSKKEIEVAVEDNSVLRGVLQKKQNGEVEAGDDILEQLIQEEEKVLAKMAA